MGPDGREVTAGAGRDPASKGRELERLRKVAQRQTLLAELLVRAPDPSTRPGSGPPGRPGRPRARGRAPRCRSSPHRRSGRRSAARSRRRRSFRRRRGSPPHRLGAPFEHRLELGLVAGPRDEVGWVLDLAAEAPDDIAIGLAEPVRDTLAAVCGDDCGEPARRLEPRRPELDPLERQRLLGIPAEPEPGANPGRRRGQLGGRGLLVLIPPAPVLARTRRSGRPARRYQCTPRIRFANSTCWFEACSSAAGGSPGCFGFFSSPFAALESGNR